ncbi:Cytochrome c-552 [bacterium HR37]|nr:Cytochrome c-552 [bacterium HR37]
MSDKKTDSRWRFRPEEEKHDIYSLHRQALREPPEPQEGLEPPPWWLWVISVLLIFWAGFYLGRYGGVFGPYVHVLEEGRRTERETALVPKEPETTVSGAEVYARVCAACHQPNGQGVPGVFPPLAGSEWVLKDPETPILIVLHGLQGPIEVKGTVYNNVMPEWGSKLSNEEIAAVLTYVRNSWGNQTAEITPDMVEKVRKETQERKTHWTQEELLKLKK